MATITTGYTQTTVKAPEDSPSTTSVFDYELNFPLYREIVKNDIIDEPTLKMELSSAQSFFTGQNMIDANFLIQNLKYGQELIVNILKDQNPFGLFKKDKLTYADNDGDTCHDHLKLNCTMPCINTLPEFDQLRFRFDCEYAYGVRMCAKNKDFWSTEFFTRQYTLSRRAYQFGREVDLWNTVIDGLVASPATTVDVALAEKHATHYWSNLGTVTAAARCAVQEAYWYMINSFADINPTVFVSDEFAVELIRSQEWTGAANASFQGVDTYRQWDFPGYMLADNVKTILGIPGNVVILKRSPWMTTKSEGLQTQYPLWSSDGTKQYVAILDPRVGYSFEKEGFHLDIKPFDCDKLYAGMIDTVYVGAGLTFNTLGLVLEFSSFEYC